MNVNDRYKGKIEYDRYVAYPFDDRNNQRATEIEQPIDSGHTLQRSGQAIHNVNKAPPRRAANKPDYCQLSALTGMEVSMLKIFVL